MTFEMTREEATDLARYLQRIRLRLGKAHQWDRPGIEDALAKARNRAASPDLAIAAIRAAKDPANRTPAVIALDGAHWRADSGSSPRSEPYDPHGWCGTCGKNERDCARGRVADDDHVFESVARARTRYGQPVTDVVAELKDIHATTKAMPEGDQL